MASSISDILEAISFSEITCTYSSQRKIMKPKKYIQLQSIPGSYEFKLPESFNKDVDVDVECVDISFVYRHGTTNGAYFYVLSQDGSKRECSQKSIGNDANRQWDNLIKCSIVKGDKVMFGSEEILSFESLINYKPKKRWIQNPGLLSPGVKFRSKVEPNKEVVYKETIVWQQTYEFAVAKSGEKVQYNCVEVEVEI